MDPLDRLLIKINVVWLLITQYLVNRKVMFAFGAAVILISLAMVNRKN